LTLPWRGLTATCGLLLAAALHPALSSVLHLPLVSISALALLLVAGLLAGPRDPGGRLVGAGAFAVALAVGYDGLRGHRGTLTLEPGQGTQSFEEEGPDGQSLGLRPLGYGVVLERVDPDGGAMLKAGDGATIAIRPGRAASHGRFRFGVYARREGAESSTRLRIAAAGPHGSSAVEVGPGAPATVDGLQISLEQYFPDFALDEKQQPYSRSAEPRNPAALVRVTRGAEAWRVFVIRAMPGIHRPEGLDHVLSLTDVVVSEEVTLRVSREPAAAVALAGMTVMALGMAWAARPA
jgi:hypothetical protein